MFVTSKAQFFFSEFDSGFENQILKYKFDKTHILKKRLVAKVIFSGTFFIILERKTQILQFSPLDGCF